MQYVILGLLLSGPLSLYDLRKRFAAGISLFYSASLGSLQRALQNLAADGLVIGIEVAGDRRGKKLYSVTDTGMQRWREWLAAPIPPGTEAETVILARVFLLGGLADARERAATLDVIRASVQDSIGALRRLATELDAVPVPNDDPRSDYPRATLDYGLRAHELLLSWIDELRAAEG